MSAASAREPDIEDSLPKRLVRIKAEHGRASDRLSVFTAAPGTLVWQESTVHQWLNDLPGELKGRAQEKVGAK